MKKLLLGLTVLLFVFAGCKNNDLSTSNDTDFDSDIVLNLQSIPTLNDTLKYQVWFYFDDNGATKPVKIGVLKPDANGNVTDAAFSAHLYDVKRAKYFVLSVERNVNDTLITSPSATRILGGTMLGNDAELVFTSNLSTLPNFNNILGKYTLFTPTDVTKNKLNGVWFLDYKSDSLKEGLKLAKLPAGWKYEGWVVKDSKVLSTGPFIASNAKDDSNKYCGAGTVPSFPGEDFLTNAPAGFTFPLDLSGASIYISVESGIKLFAPGSIKILSADVPTSATPQTTYDLKVTKVNLPAGSVKIKVKI